jgi:hypothetical protein
MNQPSSVREDPQSVPQVLTSDILGRSDLHRNVADPMSGRTSNTLSKPRVTLYATVALIAIWMTVMVPLYLSSDHGPKEHWHTRVPVPNTER